MIEHNLLNNVIATDMVALNLVKSTQRRSESGLDNVVSIPKEPTLRSYQLLQEMKINRMSM